VVIVASVDVRGGRVSYRSGAGKDEDPQVLAQRYVAEGADELHLVDLDGAERGVYANAALLAEIARSAGVPSRLAGGISSLERAGEARAEGFAGVLFSSAVFGDERLLRGIARLDGQAVVEIEAMEGALAPRGGDPELARRASGMDALAAAELAASCGIRDLYVIDLGSERQAGGPALELLERIRERVSTAVLHTGGGVRDVDDVRALARFGAASVVIGRALLEGRFTIAEAKAACA